MVEEVFSPQAEEIFEVLAVRSTSTIRTFL